MEKGERRANKITLKNENRETETQHIAPSRQQLTEQRARIKDIIEKMQENMEHGT